MRHGIAGVGFERHLTTLRRQRVVIADQGVQPRLIDLHIQQPIIGNAERDALAGRQRDSALLRADDTLVLNLPAQQRDSSTLCRNQHAFVDDTRQHRAAVADKAESAFVEIFIAQLQRRRHQTTHVDLRGLAEQHAVGVDQEHTAIGVELSHDLAAIGADDTVQGNGIGVRLMKIHPAARGDIETGPVDGQLVARLLDFLRQAIWFRNTALPAGDLAAHGQVLRVGRPGKQYH
ncbi:hypothetical protein D3C86_1095070 [compost metagenome]